MFLTTVIVTYLCHTSSKAESLEEMSPFSYSNAGNTVNFNDIFTSSNNIVGVDNVISDIKDDLFNINIPSNMVEFNTKKTTEFYITTPPSIRKFDSSVKLLRPHPIAAKDVSPYNKLTKTIDSATKEYLDNYIQRNYGRIQVAPIRQQVNPPRIVVKTTAVPIIPLVTITTTSTTTKAPSTTTRKPRRDRGILDLLFPPKRVKTFKNMFDTMKNILSYTFRR